MGDLARSAPMSYIEILLPAEACEPFVDWCGQEGVMHFIDCNEDIHAHHRVHTKTIVRAQEAETLVENIEANLREYGVQYNGEVTSESLLHRRGAMNTTLVVQEIYDDVLVKWSTLQQQIDVEKRLQKQLLGTKNLSDVLNDLKYFLDSEREASQYLQESESASDEDLKVTDIPLLQSSVHLEQLEDSESVRFQWMAGVINRTGLWVFKRQVFLSTRGNSYILTGDSLRYRDTVESDEGKETFIVFLLGNKLKTRIQQLCAALDVTILVDSTNVVAVKQKFKQQKVDIQLVAQTLELTGERLKNRLHFLRNQIVNWKSRLIQEKSLCVVLNKFKKDSSGMLNIKGWILFKDLQKVQEELEQICGKLGTANAIISDISNLSHTAPTHFPTNKLTRGFLVLIETYGVPRYLEYNPALPSIITFPFLFGVMYGDLVHGFIVFAVALSFILRERRLVGKELPEPMNYLFYGRYIMMLMGFFAMYCGLCYNDCMSLSISL